MLYTPFPWKLTVSFVTVSVPSPECLYEGHINEECLYEGQFDVNMSCPTEMSPTAHWAKRAYTHHHHHHHHQLRCNMHASMTGSGYGFLCNSCISRNLCTTRASNSRQMRVHRSHLRALHTRRGDYESFGARPACFRVFSGSARHLCQLVIWSRPSLISLLANELS